MARPSHNRTITRRVRLNAEEDARLAADAAEATKGDVSQLVRARLFDGKPLVTGKGMARPELLQSLEDMTYIVKAMDGGEIVSAKQVANIVIERIYKALRHDP